MAKRIQRKRSKGWKAPENAVYVGRPTQWGNPFDVETYGRRLVVLNFRIRLKNLEVIGQLPKFLEGLRGKDLMCWCPLDQPCHADVLLELANN